MAASGRSLQTSLGQTVSRSCTAPVIASVCCWLIYFLLRQGLVVSFGLWSWCPGSPNSGLVVGVLHFSVSCLLLTRDPGRSRSPVKRSGERGVCVQAKVSCGPRAGSQWPAEPTATRGRHQCSSVAPFSGAGRLQESAAGAPFIEPGQSQGHLMRAAQLQCSCALSVWLLGPSWL